MLVSIIIRTLNEEFYLSELLEAIDSQITEGFSIETVIVDSGSTDNTLEIAGKYGARITHIEKLFFTFGRSLNVGCDFSNGDYLVFISGHCVPKNNSWLKNLISPLTQKKCDYSYGRQIGRDTTKFSEIQVFKKYFPNKSSIPQEGFFCNNANAAISRKVWSNFRFDEDLTGLEDMFLARQITEKKGTIGYAAESIVYHIHNEKWLQIKKRYERESIALQKIMPEIRINLFDTMRFILIGVLRDFRIALYEKKLSKEFFSIFLFRFFQFYGSYKGNNINRKLSNLSKLKYFYPNN